MKKQQLNIRLREIERKNLEKLASFLNLELTETILHGLELLWDRDVEKIENPFKFSYMVGDEEFADFFIKLGVYVSKLEDDKMKLVIEKLYELSVLNPYIIKEAFAAYKEAKNQD